MQYKITKEQSRWGFTGRYIITVDGEECGEILPLYGGTERAKGYRVGVMLEYDEISPDHGPDEFRTLLQAKEAVHDFMRANCVEAA